eukprot:999235_1
MVSTLCYVLFTVDFLVSSTKNDSYNATAYDSSYDFSFTISNEAFSSKLLTGYVPGMNVDLSEKIWPAGSNDGEEFHSKWSDITLNYYSPLQVNKNLNVYLNPKHQTIDFSITNLILHSNTFNI